MEELKDIQGLDSIAKWPLALGWWLVLFSLLAVIVLISIVCYRKYKYKKSWQYKSWLHLHKLDQALDTQQIKLVLDNLALEIRRIAMLTVKREACAGLTGQQWLQWLQQHDPRSYAWSTQGQVLIQQQYMPEIANYDLAQIRDIITAAKQWVKKC